MQAGDLDENRKDSTNVCGKMKKAWCSFLSRCRKGDYIEASFSVLLELSPTSCQRIIRDNKCTMKAMRCFINMQVPVCKYDFSNEHCVFFRLAIKRIIRMTYESKCADHYHNFKICGDTQKHTHNLHRIYIDHSGRILCCQDTDTDLIASRCSTPHLSNCIYVSLYTCVYMCVHCPSTPVYTHTYITQLLGALRISFSSDLTFKQKWDSMLRYLFRPPHMVLKDQVYSDHAPAHTRLDLYAPSVGGRAGDAPSVGARAGDAPSVGARAGDAPSAPARGRRVLVFFHGGGYTVSNKASVC